MFANKEWSVYLEKIRISQKKSFNEFVYRLDHKVFFGPHGILN